MDALNLAEYLLKDIRQQKADMTQVRGLTQCEDLIRAAMKGVELEDG